MQNLFFKKILLGLIVINSSLLFSSEYEVVERDNHENFNIEILNTRMLHDSKAFKKDLTNSNCISSINKVTKLDISEDIETVCLQNIQKFEKTSKEYEKIDKKLNKEIIKQHLNNINSDDIQFYLNNSDLNNDQIKTLYYTIKHKNNSYKKQEHYEKNEQNNDDELLFMKLFLSMIQDIENRQELLFTIQALELEAMAQEIQKLKLYIQKQELFTKEQAQEKEECCPCVIL